MSTGTCIVCRDDGPFPTMFERDGFTLVRCQRCTLVFQHPQPDPAVLEQAYYHDEEFSRALHGELRQITLDRAQEKVGPLREADAIGPGLRILDVGSSSGAWLETAQAAGMRATGVELGASTAAMARSRGLDVHTGTLDGVRADLGDERFDLITFWDVLEHLPDPRHELSIARELLAPDGRLAVSFPNVDGLYPRLTYRLLSRLTGVWEYPELPVHLYDFSPPTARQLLERHGFEVEYATTYATPFDFYRSTSLSPARTGRGRRGAAIRFAFDALHRIAYPIARRTDRGNSQLLVARPTARSTGADDR